MRLDDVLADRDALIRIGGGLHLPVPFLELLDLRCRLLAGLAVGGVPARGLGRPTVLSPVHGHVPVGVDRPVNADGQVGVHHEFAGRAALGPQAAVLDRDLGANADRLPVILDQLQHVGSAAGFLGAVGGDDEHQLLSVRAQAHVVAVAGGQADAVQQPIRAVRIVVDVHRRHEERIGLHRDRLPRKGNAQVDQIADLLAVDRLGHGDAEVTLVEQLAQDVVLVGQVELQRVRNRVDPLPHLVVLRCLVLHEQGEVSEAHVARLHVDLARHRLEVGGLAALDHVDRHAVDVGELLADRVHLPVEGVALGDLARHAGRLRGQLPRADARDILVQGHVGQLAVPLVPQLEAFGLGRLVEVVLVGEVGVKLLQVVLGGEQPIATEGQHLLEQAVGGGEGEDDRLIVHLGDGGRHGLHRQPRRKHRADLLVLVDVLKLEDDVVSRERRAVGPLHALAQVEGELGTIRTRLPTLGDVGDYGRAIAGAAQQGLVPHPVGQAVVRGTGGHAPPGAAVLTYRFRGGYDCRLQGQAIGDGGQRAVRHHGLQDRRFGELTDRGAGVALEGGNRCPLAERISHAGLADAQGGHRGKQDSRYEKTNIGHVESPRVWCRSARVNHKPVDGR